MKIVILCISGITSNILAKNLQDYSDRQGKGDTFMSCKASFYKDVLPSTDVFLIAPQAISFSREVKEMCEKDNKVVIELSEENFVLKKVENIYREIEKYRITEVKQKESLPLGEVYGYVFKNTLVYSLFGLVLVGVLALINKKENDLILGVYSFVFNTIMLFLAGYFYGEKSGGRKSSSALVFLCSYFVLLAIFHHQRMVFPWWAYLTVGIFVILISVAVLELYDQHFSDTDNNIYGIFGAFKKNILLISIFFVMGVLVSLF